jgi:hypothetical protein
MAEASVFVRVTPCLGAELKVREVFPELLQIPSHIRVEGTYAIEVPCARAHAIYVDARDQYRHRKFTMDERPAKKAYLQVARELEDLLGLVPSIETPGDRVRRRFRAANPEPAEDHCYGGWEKRKAWDGTRALLARVAKA